MREPELTQDQSDRLAEALIDDVIAEALEERRSAVDRCADDLGRAQRALAEAQQALQEVRRTRTDWVRQRELDYSFGERVVMHARIADFTSLAAPPGTHVRAVRSYLEGHPPKLAMKRLAQPRRLRERVLRRRSRRT